MSNSNDAELYNTGAAAEWLDKALPGETPDYWRHQLINNRRNDRKHPHVIPHATLGKRMVVYTEEALAEFVEFERARRIGAIKLSPRVAEVVAAFGLGEGGGSGTGRKLQYSVEGLTDIDGDQSHFVRLITYNPLRYWRLSPEEAVALADELVRASKPELQSQSGEQSVQRREKA